MLINMLSCVLLYLIGNWTSQTRKLHISENKKIFCTLQPSGPSVKTGKIGLTMFN